MLSVVRMFWNNAFVENKHEGQWDMQNSKEHVLGSSVHLHLPSHFHIRADY